MGRKFGPAPGEGGERRAGERIPWETDQEGPFGTQKVQKETAGELEI